MIHVCSLSRLQETVEDTGARHVVSLIGDEARLQRPPSVAPENHLWLCLHDISSPLDGYIMPGEQHVAELLNFVRGWDRKAPLVVHCYMGISRSTASAFASVCALNPKRDEAEHRAGAAPRLADRDAEYPHRVARRQASRPQRPHGRGDRNHRPRHDDDGGRAVPARPRIEQSPVAVTTGKALHGFRLSTADA